MNTLQAERALLGAILIRGSEILNAAISEGVCAEHFNDEECEMVWDAMLRLHAKSDNIDIITVYDALGGNVDVESVMDKCPSPYHAAQYVDILLDARLRRQMRGLAQSTLDQLNTTEVSVCVPELLAETQHQWRELGTSHTDSRPLHRVAAELVEEWERSEDSGGVVSWSLGGLDDGIGRLSDEYVIMCAKESIGKTAMAAQMAVHNARRGVNVSICSLESRRDKLAQRMIANIGEVNTIHLRRRQSSQSQWERARAVSNQLKEMPIRVEDCGMTIDQVCAWGQCEVAMGAKLLIVDNLRHIRPTKGYKTPTEQFRDFSLRLKWLRDDVHVPVIVLHHLAEDGNTAWSKTDIRADVDILLFMLHDEEHSTMPDQANRVPGVWRLIFDVQKNREGNKGFVVLAEFIKEWQRITEA